jgi:hypothetical protein
VISLCFSPIITQEEEGGWERTIAASTCRGFPVFVRLENAKSSVPEQTLRIISCFPPCGNYGFPLVEESKLEGVDFGQKIVCLFKNVQ